VVLTGLTLALGSIWGRPTWGVWWTWDPRLTSTAILFMIYAGYLALRGFTDEPERRARWSAAIGILAFLNVPIVYMSVRWWRTLHQIQSSRRRWTPCTPGAADERRRVPARLRLLRRPALLRLAAGNGRR
jgi:heme exporter protein C